MSAPPSIAAMTVNRLTNTPCLPSRNVRDKEVGVHI
jgi:hypothetical protein